MLSQREAEAFRERAATMLRALGTVLTPEERARLEIADFGLGDFEREGLAVVTYVNNERYCAKELMLLPHQTCPQHRHPAVGTSSGKMETFRCRSGEVYLYVTGPETPERRGTPPAATREHYDVFHEIVLRPGEQYTIPPDTWHWFQAGPDGAVVSEFSSTSSDENDIWSNPRIDRIPRVTDE